MRFFFILSVISMLFSCKDKSVSNAVIIYKKSVYEKVSGVMIPDKCVALQTYDNDDFFSLSTLKVDSLTLIDFISRNKFKKTVNTKYPPLFFGNDVLENNKPDKMYREYSYFLEGESGTKNWLYLVDIKRNLLWVEIVYSNKL